MKAETESEIIAVEEQALKKNIIQKNYYKQKLIEK
jgi:hypothetical protein